MRITLYLDEDIPLALALSLSNRGVDVVTTHAAGTIGKSDREQPTFAASQGRALLTHNKRDFIVLLDPSGSQTGASPPGHSRR